MRKIWMSVVIAVIASFAIVAPVMAEDGDAIRFGSNVEVLAEQTVDGDIVVFGGNVNVAGRVFGDAVAIGGNADISGEVIGQVVSVGGNVHLAPTAIVQRGLVVVGGSLQREEGAQVRGDVVEIKPGLGVIPWSRFWSYDWRVQRGPADALGIFLAIVSNLMVAVALVAIALLAVVIFPTQVDVVRQTIESAPLQALGVGVLSALVSLVLTFPLILTCIGLPIFWLAVVIATLFGTVAVALLAGERLLLALNVRNFTPVSAAIAGILVIWVASLLPILGGILILFVFFFGLGAVVLSRFGTIAPPFSWQPKSPPRTPPPRT